MTKVIILTYNYELNNFPEDEDSDSRFYTYGFGSGTARLIQKYLNGYTTEVWRLDSYCRKAYYEKEVNGIRYRVFKSSLITRTVHYSGYFLKEIKKENNKSNPVFIIIHTHNWQTYLALMYLKNAKIITTHHGEWSPFFVYKKSSGLRKLRALAEMFLEKMLFRRIRFFLVCDYNQLDYLKKVNHEFNYRIYSSGIDINRFMPVDKYEARKMLGLDLNKKYILYVGKLYKYKQVDDLIKIWLDIKKVMPDAELLIVGNESRDKWGEEFYDFAVNSGALVMGRILNTELYKYYSAADVYVLISLRDDYFGGTGIAPLESLACNTPVVSNSLRNYVGENVHQLGEVPDTLDGYREAIIKVLTNPGQYTNMRQSVEKYYSHRKAAENLNYAIKTVLNNA